MRTGLFILLVWGTFFLPLHLRAQKELRDIPWSGDLKSGYVGAGKGLNVKVRTAEEILIWWVDYHGEYRLWYQLGYYNEIYFEGDSAYVFVVSDAAGGIIKTFSIVESGGELVITDEMLKETWPSIPPEKKYLKTLDFSGNPVPKEQALPILDRLKAWQVPGVSIAVLKDGEIEWAEGFGLADAKTGEKVNPDTRFAAASITKFISAIACLQLERREVIDLDRLIEDCLMQFDLPQADTSWQKPTVRDILRHEGGISKSGDSAYAAREEIPTVMDILLGQFPAKTSRIFQELPAGESFRYSNEGYSLIEVLLETYWEEGWEAYAGEMIFQPAGMKNSSLEYPPGGKNLASGHNLNETLREKRWIYPYKAASSLWTTASDLGKLLCLIAKVWQGQEYPFMDKSMLEEMVETGHGQNWPFPGDQNGMGVFVKTINGELYLTHAGGLDGFRSYFILHPETGNGAVILVNSFENGIKLIFEIIRSLSETYQWPEWEQLQKYF